jgi:hypothetical protein
MAFFHISMAMNKMKNVIHRIQNFVDLPHPKKTPFLVFICTAWNGRGLVGNIIAINNKYSSSALLAKYIFMRENDRKTTADLLYPPVDSFQKKNSRLQLYLIFARVLI